MPGTVPALRIGKEITEAKICSKIFEQFTNQVMYLEELPCTYVTMYLEQFSPRE